MRAALLALVAAACVGPRTPNRAGLGEPLFQSGGGTPRLAGGAVSAAGDLAFVLIQNDEQRPGFAPAWRGGAVVALGLAPLAARWRLPLPAEVQAWDWAPAAHALWLSRVRGDQPDQPDGLFALRPGGAIEPPDALAQGSCGRVVPIQGGRAVLALANGGGSLRYWRREYAAVASLDDLPGPPVPSCAGIELEVAQDQVALLTPLGTASDPRYGVTSARLLPTGLLAETVHLTLSAPLHSPEVRLEADALSPDGRWLALRSQGTGRPHEVVIDTATGTRVWDQALPDPPAAARFSGDQLWVARASGVTRIDLARWTSEDQAVPGCCAAIDRVADTGLLWAHGPGGGLLIESAGPAGAAASVPFATGDGHFQQLGGDLYDLVGGELRRTRLADLGVTRWPRPLGVGLIVGVDPVTGQLVLAGLDGGALDVILWSPEAGVVSELRLPLARLVGPPRGSEP